MIIQMIGCLIIWNILTAVSLVALFLDTGLCAKLIALTPLTLTISFHVFKNSNVKESNKKTFFANFKLGGHRGSPLEAPENSVESFKKAKEAGCEVVEFDIHLSSDGIPVLIHDDTTQRTSRENVTIAETTFDEIKHIPLNEVKLVLLIVLCVLPLILASCVVIVGDKGSSSHCFSTRTDRNSQSSHAFRSEVTE